MKPLYAVYGASGFGRSVMPLIRTRLLQNGCERDQLVFIDDSKTTNIINGHRILTYGEFMAVKGAESYAAVAIADSKIRQSLTEKLISDGVHLIRVQAENSIILDEVVMGEGSIICPFVTLTSNISIGKSFHANIYGYVEHDCRIGDYVTFAPAVKCNGNIVIEDHAYIGTGAIIRQGKPDKPLVIGCGAVVGMGAVVTKDVPAGSTVVGNPARPLVTS